MIRERLLSVGVDEPTVRGQKQARNKPRNPKTGGLGVMVRERVLRVGADDYTSLLLPANYAPPLSDRK